MVAPLSIAGEVERRRKLLLAALTNCGLTSVRFWSRIVPVASVVTLIGSPGVIDNVVFHDGIRRTKSSDCNAGIGDSVYGVVIDPRVRDRRA